MQLTAPVFGRRMPRPLTTRLHFALCCLIVSVAPLFAASDAPLWIGFLLVLLASACIVAPVSNLSRAQVKALALILSAFAIYGAFGLVQALPAPPWLPAHPIWSEASDLLGIPLTKRVSARAAIPDRMLSNFLLLATALAAAFPIAASRSLSLSFLRCIAWSALAYAVYGLFARYVEPSITLWGPKPAYLGDVTGPFLGRSTAAAYFGSATIIWFVLLLRTIERLSTPNLRTLILTRVPIRHVFAIGVYAAGFLVCLAATIGSHSRAGIVCALLGTIVSLWLATLKLMSRRFLLIVGVLVLTSVVILFGGAGITRIGSEGLFDPYRWATYKAVLVAINASPWLGTGWGTFPEVFPHFRTDEVSIWGTWPTAHSTPLEIAFEMGVPVALAVTSTAIVVAGMIGRTACNAKTERRFVLAASSGVVLACMLQTSLDFVLQIPHFLVVFGMIAGLGISRAHAPGPEMIPKSKRCSS